MVYGINNEVRVVARETCSNSAIDTQCASYSLGTTRPCFSQTKYEQSKII